MYNVELVDNENTDSLKKKMHSRAKGALNNANEKLTIRLSIRYATYLNKPRRFLSMVMAHHLL